MKVGLVYTSTTKELIALLEKEVYTQLGNDVAIKSYQDPSILAEVRAANRVTASAGTKLVSLYTQAILDEVDVILNICSSVGEVAASMTDFAKLVGVPIIRIDEEMSREAVRSGARIGVLATLQSTLAPTVKSIQNATKELGADNVLIERVVDNAFDLNPDEFRELMLTEALKIKDEVDVIVLAQGSMAYIQDYLADKTHCKVLSSPSLGVKSVKNALKMKGLI